MFCYLPGHKISKAMSVSHRMPYDQKNGVVKKKYFFLILKKMSFLYQIDLIKVFRFLKELKKH